MSFRAFHVLVPLEDGTTETFDGIAYSNKLWLVPAWNEFPAQQVRQPIRMIRFDVLAHQMSAPGGQFDYVVAEPVPRSVLDGQTTEGFEILSGTEITFGLRFPRRH